MRIRNQLSYSPFTSRRRRIVEEFGKILRASIAKGLLSGKAIALPALLIQGLILVIVCGYYFYPPARQIIEVAVNLKKEGGFFFSFVCTASIAVLADCLRAAFGDAESRRRLLPNCAYGFLVFGILGVLRFKSPISHPHLESQFLNALSSVSPRLGSIGGGPVSVLTLRC